MKDTFDFAVDALVQAHGEAIVYNNEPMRAVFGSEFTAVQSGDVRLSTRRPEIMVRLADMPNPHGLFPTPLPKPGDVVVVRERPFSVVTVRPDIEDVSAILVLKATD